MSSIIKILDDNLINQIAAGEVIERPVSVVKELVENSLDAGATDITLTIENGGKTLIKVSDNGTGMSREDLELSIVRHATSKLRTPEDLFRISTMGFRGEALPSIASVSRMTIASKNNTTENYGFRLDLDASKIKQIEKTAQNQGTTIEVKDLFYNLPARLKFLKKDDTEFSHIQNFISRLMLSRPDVSYTFINDEKVVLKTQGLAGDQENSLKNAIATVYGTQVAKNLRKLDLELADISISGFISEPTLLTSSRSGQVLFVNNRNIFSPVLNKAIDNAVSDLIPGNKYPYAVIFIDIDYSLVDVNVHPTKKEVRFADSGKVFEAVKSAVKNAYARIDIQQTNFQDLVKGTPSFEHRQHFSPEKLAFKNTQENFTDRTGFDEEVFPAHQDKNNLTVLGQAYKGFIIVLDGEELLLIDQHAAHERLLYEQLKNNYGQKTNLQQLLIPENIELGTDKLAKIMEYGQILQNYGFEWEKFSETSILLRAVPALNTKINLAGVLKQLLDELHESQQAGALDQIKENILATIACKAAVKAGDILDISEMRQLVRGLFKTPNYQTCPHGRPVITIITREELAKRFKRT